MLDKRFRGVLKLSTVCRKAREKFQEINECRKLGHTKI